VQLFNGFTAQKGVKSAKTSEELEINYQKSLKKYFKCIRYACSLVVSSGFDFTAFSKNQ
jgi:hypothetical protein